MWIKDAQTDLNLHWARMLEGIFSYVTAHLISVSLCSSFAGVPYLLPYVLGHLNFLPYLS